MAKKIYLIGGGDVKEGKTKEIDTKAFADADNKNVFVLNLTTNDKQKITEYINFLNSYFKELGATNVSFASELNSDKIIDQLNNSGLLYIPGGDTELLIKNVGDKGLDKYIKNYKGVIVGNSAGAYLMCSEYIKIRDSGIERFDSLGLVDARMKAHYTEEFDSTLNELSEEIDIYGVPECSALVWNNGLNFIGDIYLFSKGQKTKVN
jgi:peptidase E